MSLLFNTVLDVLTRAIRQEKERKGIQIRKKEEKQFLFIFYIILYTENPEVSTKRLELMKEFSTIGGYKINIQKPIMFLREQTSGY